MFRHCGRAAACTVMTQSQHRLFKHIDTTDTTDTDTTAHRKHSLGITDVWQLLQVAALPEDSFPELNPNNSENEEHEKTKKQHIA